MENKTKKIAIISPSFFSYIPSIIDLFKLNGHECDFYDERFSNNVWAKAVIRLGIANFLQRNYLQCLKASLSNNNYTDVLLITVETIDRQFVELLKSSGISVHLYMWDSAKNKPNFVAYLDMLDGKATFDPEDSKAYGMGYIPLFADHCYLEAGLTDRPRDVDISFCGTLHSNRAYLLKQLAKISNQYQWEIDFKLYYHSRLFYAITAIFDYSRWYFFRVISDKGYDKKSIASSMSRSRFVIDIQHPGQKGLTARVFESLATGATLISFNDQVLKLPSFINGKCFYVTSVDEVVDILDRDYRAPELNEEARDYLSISRFVCDLLRLIDQK